MFLIKYLMAHLFISFVFYKVSYNYSIVCIFCYFYKLNNFGNSFCLLVKVTSTPLILFLTVFFYYKPYNTFHDFGQDKEIKRVRAFRFLLIELLPDVTNVNETRSRQQTITTGIYGAGLPWIALLGPY